MLHILEPDKRKRMKPIRQPSLKVMDNIRCVVCGNHNPERYRVRVRRPDFAVAECLDCSFHFIPLAFRKSVDYTRYKSDDVAAEVAKADEWLKVQRNLLRYRLIRKYRRSGKIYDIGCGFGHFLLTGRRLGYDVSGVEMSRANAAYVRGTLGIGIDEGDFLDVKEGVRYDVLTLWDVLEHVDGAGRVVEKAARMIKPGGMLFIQVPRLDSSIASLLKGKWWAMGLDHVNYFSKRTVQTMLRRHGFDVEKTVSSIELKNILVYVLLPKLKRKKNGPSATAAARQREFNRITRKPMWMRRLMVLAHNALYACLSLLGIGDEMIVVARKRPSL
jgi:2-polyprenyl-3-methyl-5-hydroxy-6-metoxy-1,4-benzoquinol methylase